jgi:hypothetical protein
MQQPHTVFDALQLAVSPVILTSACGLLLLSMTNRLGRAIDRARLLVRESKSNRAIQIDILMRRARWIRSSILFIAICIFLTALLILALFMSVFLPFDVTLFVAVLFVASISCLGISLVYFMIDIFSSLRAMETDLENELGEL